MIIEGFRVFVMLCWKLWFFWGEWVVGGSLFYKVNRFLDDAFSNLALLPSHVTSLLPKKGTSISLIQQA
jgi:hypothetical protein